MNVDLGIWAKLTRVVIFLLFLAGILGVAVWYLPLIERNQNSRKIILDLDKRLQAEEERKKQLKAAIDSLQRDPKAVERLARERLGYAKTGETVIRFEASLTNSTTNTELRPVYPPSLRRSEPDGHSYPPAGLKPAGRLPRP
jgi:cell division protein FtsB